MPRQWAFSSVLHIVIIWSALIFIITLCFFISLHKMELNDWFFILPMSWIIIEFLLFYFIFIFVYLFIFLFFLGFLNPSLYLYAELIKAQEDDQGIPSSSSSSSSSFSSSSSSFTTNPLFNGQTLHAFDGSPLPFYRDVSTGDNKCLKDPYEYCCLQGFSAVKGWDPVSGMILYSRIIFFSL